MQTKDKIIRKATKILIIIALLTTITIGYICVSRKTTYASSQVQQEENEQNQINEKETVQNQTQQKNENQEEIRISKKEKINIQEIIDKNNQNPEMEQIKTETVDLEYITIYKENSNIPKGTVQTTQEGRTGKEQIITKITYENGEPKEELISRTVTKASFNKIVEIGTGEKIEITNNLNETISLNMSLNTPSGLTLEQFKKVLTDEKDKNKIFEKNAEYFYYIEEQYNINGIFVAAVAIHESGWGTSNLAKNKYNLFGYGAVDSDPYNNAYKFTSYSESIDLMARVFVKYYLNPKGTKIYDNETATGRYYNGNTLCDVNEKYATDKNWANKVYNHMEYLYNKI